MNTFLVVNGVLVAIVVLSLLVGRKRPPPPMRLELRSGDPPPSRDVGSNPSHPSEKLQLPSVQNNQLGKPPGWENYRPRHVSISAALDEEKDLNIMFNWNGHSWDAYEVLGIPAGSSPSAVLAALKRMKQNCEPETVPFLEAAARAILQS